MIYYCYRLEAVRKGRKLAFMEMFHIDGVMNSCHVADCLDLVNIRARFLLEAKLARRRACKKTVVDGDDATKGDDKAKKPSPPNHYEVIKISNCKLIKINLFVEISKGTGHPEAERL